MAASPPASETRPRHIVVMGVSGCGKSTVGAAVAAGLGLPFLEGDSLHPPANVAKMAAGQPLEDADRWPWLDRIGAGLAGAPGGLVATCSALRRAYRDRLRGFVPGLRFVHLSGSPEVLAARTAARRGHFMPPALLASQLATLEDPGGEQGVITLDIDGPAEDLARAALAALRSGAG